MEEIDLKELSTEILNQKLETLNFNVENIGAAYNNELETFCRENNIKESNKKSDRFVKKLNNKYAEYLAPIVIEIEEIESEIARREKEEGEKE